MLGLGVLGGAQDVYVLVGFWGSESLNLKPYCVQSSGAEDSWLSYRVLVAKVRRTTL